MEKIARRNIMAIYGDWRIFRRILKRDLALDRTSGRRGSRRRIVGEGDLGGGSKIESAVAGADVASDESSSWTGMDLHEIDDKNALLI